MCVWLTLGLPWDTVSETMYSFLYIPWHQQVHHPLHIIPVKVDATVPAAHPARVNLIMLTKHTHQVLSMLPSHVLHLKVVGHECKADGPGFVRPEAQRHAALALSVHCQPLLKQSLQKDTRLWQSIHAFAHLHKDKPVRRDYLFNLRFITTSSQKSASCKRRCSFQSSGKLR